MEIYKLIGSLDGKELRIWTYKWEFIRETNTYYEIKSEVRTKRLKKSELNIITSDVYDPHISYSVFCLESEFEEHTEEILRRIEDHLIKQEESIKAKRESLRKYIFSK